MANFVTGRDVLTNVLSRADELGIGLSDRETEAKAYIQAAYIAVVGDGFPWAWGKKIPNAVLNTVAELTTGTVSVANGSTSLTFSSAPAASVATRKFFVDDDRIIYRIASHTAAQQAATLDAVFVGTTAAAATFHVFQDEYDLASDFLRPIGKKLLRDMQGRYPMDLIGEDELSQKYAYPGAQGDIPRYCTMIAEQTLRVAPWPTTQRRYEYSYIFHPGQLTFDGVVGTDTLIISPAEDRIVVSFFAIGNLLADKNDSRAGEFLQAGAAKLKDMRRLGLKLMHPRSWVRPGSRVSTYR